MLVRELPNGRLLEASSILELRVAPERLTGEIARFVDECWPAGQGGRRARKRRATASPRAAAWIPRPWPAARSRRSSARRARAQGEQEAAAAERRKRMIGYGAAGAARAGRGDAIVVVVLAAAATTAAATTRRRARPSPGPTTSVARSRRARPRTSRTREGRRLQGQEARVRGPRATSAARSSTRPTRRTPATTTSSPPRTAPTRPARDRAARPLARARPGRLLVPARRARSSRASSRRSSTRTTYHMLLAPNDRKMPSQVAASSWTRTIDLREGQRQDVGRAAAVPRPGTATRRPSRSRSRRFVANARLQQISQAQQGVCHRVPGSMTRTLPLLAALIRWACSPGRARASAAHTTPIRSTSSWRARAPKVSSARGDREYVSPALRAPKRFNWSACAGAAAREHAHLRVRGTRRRPLDPVARAADRERRGPRPRPRRAPPGSASAPAWAGQADWVQYRSERRLPGAIHFVNTTARPPATAAARRRVTGHAPRARARRAAEAQPAMVSRDGWGAENCPPRERPDYGDGEWRSSTTRST